MADLDKRISGDWIELREKSNDLYALLDLFGLPALQLRAAADTLRHCVEQGMVEFKRTLLAPTLVALEGARFKSLEAGEMDAQEKTLSSLLLAILLQRLLCTEALPRSRPAAPKAAIDADSLQVSAILADVNARVKSDPSLRAHVAVKNILMQVQRYNAENQKMRELVATIRPEMRQSFLANFTRTFDEIIGSIRRQYATLLQEEADVGATRKEGFSLAQAPLKELAPLLLSQAKEVSRFRSTFAHAREEKYKTREVLVRLYDGRPALLKLVEEEMRAYRRVCQQVQPGGIDECASAMAAGFRDEVAALLEKRGKEE